MILLLFHLLANGGSKSQRCVKPGQWFIALQDIRRPYTAKPFQSSSSKCMNCDDWQCPLNKTNKTNISDKSCTGKGVQVKTIFCLKESLRQFGGRVLWNWSRSPWHHFWTENKRFSAKRSNDDEYYDFTVPASSVQQGTKSTRTLGEKWGYSRARQYWKHRRKQEKKPTDTQLSFQQGVSTKAKCKKHLNVCSWNLELEAVFNFFIGKQNNACSPVYDVGVEHLCHLVVHDVHVDHLRQVEVKLGVAVGEQLVADVAEHARFLKRNS